MVRVRDSVRVRVRDDIRDTWPSLLITCYLLLATYYLLLATYYLLTTYRDAWPSLPVLGIVRRDAVCMVAVPIAIEKDQGAWLRVGARVRARARIGLGLGLG